MEFTTKPKPLAGVMTSLNQNQKKAIRDLGFGSLIGFDIIDLPLDLLFYVVDSFDNEEMLIRTSKGDIKCDRDAVFDVFGIRGGTVDIKSLDKVSDSFHKDWCNQFDNVRDITTSEIESAITNSNGATDEFFKMNFLMLFANTMIGCETNGVIKYDVLEHISSKTVISEIDWIGLLLNELQNSKNNWNRESAGKNPYAGPSTFLTVSSLCYPYCICVCFTM